MNVREKTEKISEVLIFVGNPVCVFLVSFYYHTINTEMYIYSAFQFPKPEENPFFTSHQGNLVHSPSPHPLSSSIPPTLKGL